MLTQASHEDRVKAVIAAFERGSPLHFSATLAKGLAKLAVDAVEAADNTEAENRAEARRQDRERRLRDIEEGRAYPK